MLNYFITKNILRCISEQNSQYMLWKRAVDRSIGWNKEEEDEDFPGF